MIEDWLPFRDIPCARRYHPKVQVAREDLNMVGEIDEIIVEL